MYDTDVLDVPFVGKDCFPMLSYLDEVKENRTGISKASMGLDPDALQSATASAVQATVQGGQQHIELIARIFAETGMKLVVKLQIHSAIVAICRVHPFLEFAT